MKVIPVVDVLNGAAVHGVRGERTRYQPLKSVVCKSTDPLKLALAFESLGFTELYLADLDAILGKPANLNVFRRIVAETGLDLMVDAGTGDFTGAKKVLATGASKVVVGSETLERLDFLGQAVKSFGEDRVVVSVDLKDGKVLGASESVASLDAVSFVQELGNVGVTTIILLDLTRVGTEQGINRALLKNILDQTRVEVLVGGGVRSLQELEELQKLGVSGALVATILHNGKLKVDELRSANLL
jgi:phosphoribosylformimino-5-aminoimidazole carboxamide ribotide isomerase